MGAGMSIKTNPPGALTHVHAVICHGGNFAGGSAAWDSRLVDWLREAGVGATRFDYATGAVPTAEGSVAATVKAIEEAPAGKEVALVGVSSGGFWAAQCALHPRVTRVVLVAPVLDPVARWTARPELEADGRRVLGDAAGALTDAGIRNLNAASVCIMHSTADDRSPAALYAERLPRAVFEDVGGSHTDVCGFRTGDAGWEFLAAALQGVPPLVGTDCHK